MERLLLFSILLTATNAIANTHLEDSHRSSHRKCEEITIPMCKGIGYNQTMMPNRFNHQKQEEAGLEVHQFWPLVEVKCSKYLKFFLCSMYTPICLPDYHKSLPPCKSVCQAAQDGCAPLMIKYGFQWPENLDCQKLPESGDPDNLCMEPPKDDKSDTEPEVTTRTSKLPTDNDNKNNNKFPAEILPIPDIHSNSNNNDQCKCSCRDPFVTVHGEGYGSREVGNVSHCAYPCYSPYLKGKEDRQHFLTTWIGVWSVSCCLITFITVITFFIDMDRFRYPERPIFFVAICYLLVSIGYIIRLVAGHEAIACDNSIVRAGSTDPAICTAVFLLIYFFGMASSVWWVVLALTWFLAAGLKWSNEAIASYAQYFHIFAWALPSIKTVAILALSAVDGDPLAGICYVGNTNVNYLRAFVLGPLFAYLVLGCCFLAAGFVSLIRIHNVVKAQHGHSKIEKLEQLMVKIGIFSVLYTIPAAFVIGCLFYEQHYRQLWELQVTCSCVQQVDPGHAVFVLALIKYSMSLVVGITSGLWIWSPKTLQSWRRCCMRVCCCQTHYGHPGGYQPAEAIIIKSHTDISSQGAYSSRHGYPLNHV